MDNTAPPWTPDWTNPGKYPNPNKATPQEWAWEFLRRNEEYQTDYLNLQLLELETWPSYKKKVDAANAKWRNEKGNNPGKRIKRILVANEPVSRMRNRIRKKFDLAFGPINPAENTPTNINKIFRANRAIVHLEAELEWVKENEPTNSEELLSMMRETTESDYFQPEYSHYFYDYLKHTIRVKKNRKMEIDALPSELTFSIDLLGNIKSQIKEIKSIVSTAKKKLKAEKVIVDRDFIPATYLFYLRFHDACKRGKTHKELAVELKNYKEFSETAKRAMTEHKANKDKLIQSGYREIAAFPSDWLEKRIP